MESKKIRQISVGVEVFEALEHYGLILQAMIKLDKLDGCAAESVISDLRETLSTFLSESLTSVEILQNEYKCVKTALSGDFDSKIESMKGYNFFLGLISDDCKFEKYIIEEMVKEEFFVEDINNDSAFEEISNEADTVIEYLHLDRV